MASNFLSPMPETFLISSIEEKDPFAWRYAMILAAVASPTPSREVSSEALAVLMFTFPWEEDG